MIYIFSVYDVLLEMLFLGSFFKLKEVSNRNFLLALFGAGIVNLILALNNYNTALNICSYCIPIFILSFFYEANIAKKTLYVFIYAVIAFFTITVASKAMMFIATSIIEEALGSYLMNIACIVSGCMIMSMVIYTLRCHFIKPQNHEFPAKLIKRTMFYMPIQAIFLCTVFLVLAPDSRDIINEGFMAVVLLYAFALIWKSACIANWGDKTLRSKFTVKQSQSMLKLDVNHRRELKLAADEEKRLRNFMNSELRVVFGMLAKGEVDKAIERLEKSAALIENDKKFADSGHPMFDSVVTSKMLRAYEDFILINYKVDIKDSINVNQTHIALILETALDNAIDAIKKNKGLKTKIEALVLGDKDDISIKIENYALADVDKRLLTAKPGKKWYGSGLNIIQTIANAYDGAMHASYDIEEQLFTLSVTLKNVEAANELFK